MSTQPPIKSRWSLAALNKLSREAFVTEFCDIYEHSPWVAAQAWEALPFASRHELQRAMYEAVAGAEREAMLTLIRAHPDLAGKQAEEGELTEYSSKEQAHAGLNACSADELALIRTLNSEYKKKFGFPFILAVKGLTRADILQRFQQRLHNPPEVEFAENLWQIGRIAGFRLAEKVAND